MSADYDNTLDASSSPAAPIIRSVASMFLVSLLPEGHPLRAELSEQLTADLSVLARDAAFRANGGDSLASSETSDASPEP